MVVVVFVVVVCRADDKRATQPLGPLAHVIQARASRAGDADTVVDDVEDEFGCAH